MNEPTEVVVTGTGVITRADGTTEEVTFTSVTPETVEGEQ